MRTTQPSVILGSYVWAQDRLPQDEFVLRLDALRSAMERNSWPAILAYGDVRDHGALAYLTNFVPRVRWGMALLPRSGDARLLCAMSTRDLPAMRNLTWIADVQSGMGPEWVKGFDPWFERFRGERAVALGTLGFDSMAPVLFESVRRSLGEGFLLRPADDVSPMPPLRKRPRELTMIRAACEVLQFAVQAFVQSWRKEPNPEAAALDAERAARSHAAQDVRTLVSLDGGRTLVPYQGRFETKAGRLVGYIAVKVVGYWADMFVTLPDRAATAAVQRAEGALAALIAGIRSGASTAALYAATAEALRPFALHPMLGGSVGHGIGLSLDEKPEFRAAEDSALQEDGIYTLQVGIAGGKNDGKDDSGKDDGGEDEHILISAIVRSTAKGAEVLARSPAIAKC
jgi:Xaa-Pro aminopeptidase